MTSAKAAYGTLLKIGDGGGPETFTTIAEVTNISGPSLSLAAIEATSMDSGGWEESIGGVKSGGEVSFDLSYLPTHATHDASTGLIADLKNAVARNFQLVFPDAGGTTWSFTALVTAFEPSAPVDGRLQASVTLKITGQPTLA